jgi:hypothetical protein
MVLFMTAWTPHVTVATVVEKDGRFLFVEEHSEGLYTLCLINLRAMLNVVKHYRSSHS